MVESWDMVWRIKLTGLDNGLDVVVEVEEEDL